MLDSWNDDEGWMGIALMQAFKAMGTNSATAFPVAPTISGGMNNTSAPAVVQDAETLQADIEKSWTPEGGVTWDKPSAGSSWYNQFYRDTAANMADAVLSVELYTATRHQSYLADAKQLFDWEWNTLVLPKGGTADGAHYGPGTVLDGVDWDPLSQQNTFPSGGTAQWTYNYGLVIGAAVELFKLTGNGTYLSDAELVANAAMKQFAKADDVMAGVETGGGDGGLFKGIFMRYMIDLLKVDGQNQKLLNFVQANLSSLWENDQTTTTGVFGNNWAGPAPTASSVDLTDQLSAVMSFTSMATYQQAAENFPKPSSTASPKGSSVYSALPAMMESTNASAPYSYYVQVGGSYEPDNSNIGGWGDGAGNEAVILPVWTEHPGTVKLTIRYANASNTTAPRDLYVNGAKVGSLTFNSTGDWDTWSTVQTTVHLKSGANTVELVAPASSTSAYLNLNQIVTSAATVKR
jgi:predicted alpha-1,6-mannanase (GH76 family)